MTHNERVLLLLSDGRPHTHHEVYRLGVVGHSRVSDLRKAGYDIAQWREGDNYVYRLLNGELGSAGVADGAGVVPSASTGTSSGTAPVETVGGRAQAGSLGSAAGPLPDSVSPPAVATPKAYADPPELPPSPMHSAGAPPQLSLLTDAA